jgi:Tfp pilus assembly protein PilO
MNAIFERLNDKERTMLRRLGIAALAMLAVSLLLVLRLRNGYLDARDNLDLTREQLRSAEKTRAASQAEWIRWQQAGRDLESFRGTFFYDEKTLIRTLRMDLQQIFNETGMNVPQIVYNYSDVDKGQIKRVAIVFNYAGTYADLKRFLAVVERFPRSLTVEKIDFLKTGEESGYLNLKLTLAAYYEI